MKFLSHASQKLKLRVWENGKAEIKSFMHSIGSNYFLFPKILGNLGFTGNLDIVHNEERAICIFDENNQSTDIVFLEEGCMQVIHGSVIKQYQVSHHFFHFNVTQI